MDHTRAAGGKGEGLDNKFPALHIIRNKLVLRELLLTPGLHPDERSGTARLPVVSVAGGHPHCLDEAAERVLNDVAPFGGRGGLIAVNTEGQVVLPFQTMLMYRGLYQDGTIRVGIGPDFIQS